MLREWLWETLTGTPYYTERRASAEFGPPIAVRTGAAHCDLSDEELMLVSPHDLIRREVRR